MAAISTSCNAISSNCGSQGNTFFDVLFHLLSFVLTATSYGGGGGRGVAEYVPPAPIQRITKKREKKNKTVRSADWG